MLGFCCKTGKCSEEIFQSTLKSALKKFFLLDVVRFLLAESVIPNLFMPLVSFSGNVRGGGAGLVPWVGGPPDASF